jgi:hypothetical protein
MLTEMRMILALSALFFFPGAALLILSGAWRRWEGLQRYILAVGLSIATLPVLFYTVRFWLPGVTLHAPSLGVLLLLAAGATAWGVWRHGRDLVRLQGLEWVAVAIFALTALSRFWFAQMYPFPAWSDSLHHVMLTELTAQQGMLPSSLMPYYPVDFDMYHLGLYALSATAMQLAQVPAPTALLWTAQFLNSACAFGVYLALDRYVGRTGALVGAATVGLFSVQPALYANWGRFTQLASQAILLIAAVAVVECTRRWAMRPDDVTASNRVALFWDTLLAALLSAAVFLLHFRVALFYLPLLALCIVYVIWQALRNGEKPARALLGIICLGAMALLLVLPTFWEAAASFAAKVAVADEVVSTDEVAATTENYYQFPWSSVPYLVAPRWLLWTTLGAAVIGVLRRNVVVIIALAWMVLLYLIGNAYLTGISLLSLTNLGAVLIMFYLPVGLIIGAAGQELLALLPQSQRMQANVAVATALLLLGIWGVWARAHTVEPYRHFVAAADLAALDWVDANVPDDAKFGINTYFWLPRAPHGVDAGYWLPYITGNPTNAAAMLLYGEADPSYGEEFMLDSQAVEQLEDGPEAVGEVYDRGIEYLFIGTAGDFSGPGLDLDLLRQSPRVRVLYEVDGVAVLQLLPGEES